MSYVVLARRYRPPDFAALVGQEHVVQALSNALTQQRLHHAYLFTGTRGVGKTTISRILAKSLNCTGADGQGGITAHPCGVCQACRDIDAGRFIDYVELDAASNRGVDEISQLLDQAVYKPVLGRFKVYMVDEVHMLSTTAFNAMLKTLEEPPDYLKFVLATTDPQKVPATVLSRCLQFNLRPMAPQTVQAHLVDVLERESIPAEPGALRLLSRAARGSMRDALSLADQAIAFGGGSLAEEGVRDMLGAVDRSHVARIVEALAGGDGAALIAAVDGLRALGLSAGGALEEMAALLQQMAVLQAIPAVADSSDPQTPESLRLAGLLAADEVQLFYSIALHGRAELGLAPDEYSGLVMVLLRMLAFKPQGDAPATPSRSRADAAPALSSAVAQVAAPARDGAAVTAADGTEPRGPRPRIAAPASQAAAMAAPPVLRVPAGSARRLAEEPPPWLYAPPDAEEDGQAVEMSGSSVGSESSAAGAGMTRGDAGTVATRRRAGETDAESLPPGVTTTPVSSPPIQTTALGDRWAEHVGRMIAAGGIGAMVRELAMQSQCVAMDEAVEPAVCRLRVEREMLRAPAIVDKLQLALTAELGHDVRIATEAGFADDSPSRREAAERERRQGEAEKIIHDDPLVRALMAQYNTARIVPGSVKPH